MRPVSPIGPALVALLVPALAGAQTGEVRLDMGAARSLPPAHTDAVEASYALLGISGERWWRGGSGIAVSVVGGHTLGPFGSDWATGQVVGELWTDRGTVDFGLGARGYAFRVGRPFVWETTTGEVWPQIRLSGSRLALTLKAEGGYGGSYIALHRADGHVRRGTHDLWHYGGGGLLESVFLGGLLGGGAALYEGAAGQYRRAYAEFTRGGGPLGLRLSGEVWDTPIGVRYAGGLGVQINLGSAWSMRILGGKGEPDPLIRAPQGVQGGALLGIRVFDLSTSASPVVSLGRALAGGTVVRFVLPGGSGEPPALLGDFNGWEAQPMRRESGAWVLEVLVGPGTYHFGFTLEGEWYLPPGVPGRVSDDWGQQNGTLVVPGTRVTGTGS